MESPGLSRLYSGFYFNEVHPTHHLASMYFTQMQIAAID